MPRRVNRLLILLVGVVAVGVFLLMSGLFGGLIGGGDGPGPADRSGSSPAGLSGQVLSASGAPAPAGVRVTVHGARKSAHRETDERGRFRFEELPEGSATLEARLGPLLARADLTSGPVEVRLPGVCRIAGRVVDAGSTAPVRGAVIRCAGKMAQAGERGAFTLEEVPVPDARPPRVEVSAPTHTPLSFRPPVAGDWEDLYLRMKPR